MLPRLGRSPRMPAALYLASVRLIPWLPRLFCNLPLLACCILGIPIQIYPPHRSRLSSSNPIYLLMLLIFLQIMVIASCTDLRSLIQWCQGFTSTFPFRNDCEKLLSSMNPLQDQICFSILTAPLASPNSHLLFSTRSSLFDWSVGSHSWSELPYSGARIVQIVQFNGQFIAMDFNDRIYTLELAPQFRLQEITTNLFQGLPVASWLVVCSDMLLRVGHVCDHIPDRMGLTVAHTVHRLDMSSKPAKWVNMEKLDNWAVFAGGDMRNMLLRCMNPERWGGRSSCLYHARNSPPWIVHGLVGAPGQRDNRTIPYGIRRHHVQSFWVYPSMLYSDGRGSSRATATTA